MPAALSRDEHSCPFLPRCSMRSNRIGNAGAAALSEALKSNATVTSLK
jgi:hypothetical protein